MTLGTSRRWLSRAGLARFLRGRGSTVAVTAVLLAGLATVTGQHQAPATSPAGPPADPRMSLVADEAGVKATESEAFAEAISTGLQVEIGAYRGERQEVFANPDGTLTSVEHAQPVRTVRDGRWMSVDPTLVAESDGSIRPKATNLSIRLSGGGDVPLIVTERAGRILTLDWPGELPKPVLAADQATYSEVLPGIDLVVTVRDRGFSHVLVVKNAKAAANPKLAELSFEMATKGLTAHHDDDRGLTILDTAGGGAVFEAAAPLMWDSGMQGTPADDELSLLALPQASAGDDGTDPTREAPDSARQALMSMSIVENKLTLRPNQAMLADPTTRWPVYIDPVWESPSNSAWAMVAQGFPNQSYWKFGGSEGVGLCPQSTDPLCNGVRIKQQFFALPTPYGGKTILEAKFKITMTRVNNAGQGVTLVRSAGGISSATTWSNRPAPALYLENQWPSGVQGSCTPTNQNVTFNATPAVREAAANGWSTTTFGLQALDDGTESSWKKFCGNAVLAVQYNRAPTQPSMSSLTLSPGGSCVTGSARSYVSVPPKLNAILTDPDTGDAEPLNAEFRVAWTPPGESQQTRSWTSPQKENGSTFTFDLADGTSGVPNLPENVVVAWEVRAGDGTVWGPWSSDGAATPCEFVLDKTKPAGPDVDSPEYLPLDVSDSEPACVPDETWHDGVGRWGSFIFDSSATDVNAYEYGFDAAPSSNNRLTPAVDGGPVTLRWVPETMGPHVLQVRAMDRAGKTSDTTTCIFRVAAGAPAVAQWALAENPDATTAGDATGAHPATAGPGAVFGAIGPGGAADRAVRLNGEANSYLETRDRGIVDTNSAFTVSAWAYLADDTRDAVAVSQSGSGESGFILGFDRASKRWKFETAVTDVNSLGSWQVLGPTAVTNRWVHLAATFDAETRTMSLYVNGEHAASAPRRSAWKSRGAIEVGRRQTRQGFTGAWTGSLADVTLFNRLVVSGEISQLAMLAPHREAYWELDSAVPVEGTDTLISPEYTGDQDKNMTLRNGALIYSGSGQQTEPPLVGAGYLVLDGVDDVATTASPLVNTGDSFTLTARVRLPGTCTRTMAVLSQPGVQASAFTLRCAVVEGRPRWELVITHQDAAGSPETTVLYDDVRVPSADNLGQHLAVSYNAFTGEARLYVDGQLAISGAGVTFDVWTAEGEGLQLGRTKVDGTWQDPFSGAIDEVRAYTGVLDQTTIQRLAAPIGQGDI